MAEDGTRRTVRPPYAPVKGVRDFFEKVTSKNPPPRVDKDYLSALGVAASNEQHLVAALKFLRLIDDAGRPTKAFDVLYLKGPDRKRGLLNLVRLAYPSLFASEIALESAGRAEIHDHFVRRYNLHGQMARKATALFTLLCTLAGIPLSPELVQEIRVAGIERTGRKGNRRDEEARSGAVARRDRSGVEAQLEIGAFRGWPIALLLRPEMSEEEIVSFLRRVQRALRAVEEEGP